MTTLSAYLFGHSLVKIAYPFVPSIHSALALTRYINGGLGAVYFAECQSDDGTLGVVETEFAREIETGELKILKHDWGTHHTIQAHICNYILDQIGESVTFAMKMDADEVIHEDSFGNCKDDLIMMERFNFGLGDPHYIHFCPDDRTQIPFIYDHKAVVSKTDHHLRFNTNDGDDACGIGGAPEFRMRLELSHYGKMAMGREMEAIFKEWDFQQLYITRGFPDPIVRAQWEKGTPIDYKEIFHDTRDAGQFVPFIGTHPVFVRDWLEDMELRSEKFWRNIEQSRKTEGTST